MSNKIQYPGKYRKYLHSCLIVFLFLLVVAIVILVFINKLIRSISENIPPVKQKVVKTEIWDNSEFVNSLKNLELAERQANEIIEETETSRYNIPWWGPVEPSSAKFEIRFKALYIYYVSARKSKWHFEYRDGVAYVSAPKIICRASVDTSTIKGRVETGWLVTREHVKLRKLEKGVSQIADKRSLDRKHINMVREICRKSLEKFIFTWFLKKRYPVKDIRVKFADENGFGILDGSDETAIRFTDKGEF